MSTKKVKRTLPFFASSMSGGNMDVLEDIVSHRYEEILCVFQLLKDRVDWLEDIRCKEKPDVRLSIEAKITDDEMTNDIYDEILNMIPDIQVCSVDITKEDRVLMIRVQKR